MAIVTDEIIVICKGCGGRRMVDPKVLKNIRSVEDLIEKVINNIPRCDCGAKTCDLQIRLPPEKQPS